MNIERLKNINNFQHKYK